MTGRPRTKALGIFELKRAGENMVDLLDGDSFTSADAFAELVRGRSQWKRYLGIVSDERKEGFMR